MLSVNQILLCVCHYRDLPHLYPLLEGYADIFNYLQRRQVLHETMQVLDEEQTHPTLYLASHEGRMIGYLGFRRDRDEPGDFNLFSMLVKRGYQGQGVGTKIFDYAVRDITRLGARKLRVRIGYAYPVHTKHFYQRLGFHPQLDEHYTGASDEDLLYVKRLV